MCLWNANSVPGLHNPFDSDQALVVKHMLPTGPCDREAVLMSKVKAQTGLRHSIKWL